MQPEGKIKCFLVTLDLIDRLYKAFLSRKCCLFFSISHKCFTYFGIFTRSTKAEKAQGFNTCIFGILVFRA